MTAQPSADYLLPLLQQLPTLDYPAKVAALQAAALAHAHDPRPYALLAAEHAQAKAYDQAEAAYMRVLAAFPDYALARFQLGLLQLTSGRPAAAAAAWDRLLLLPPDHALRVFAEGLNAMAVDDFPTATAKLTAGIALNTTNAPLNTDMQRFVGEIAKLEQSNRDRDSAGVGQKGLTGVIQEPEQDAEAVNPLFLSAYKGGH